MMITLHDYINIYSKETAVYPPNTMYPFMGLVGEAIEFLEAVTSTRSRTIILDELGDVFWYIAAVIRDYDLHKLIEESITYYKSSEEHMATKMVIKAGAVLEQIKKHVRKGDLDSALNKKLLAGHLNEMIAIGKYVTLLLESNLSLLLEYNYDKLRCRKSNGTLKERH